MCYLGVSLAATLLAEGALRVILDALEAHFLEYGYRSTVLGLDGILPQYRALFYIILGVGVFALSFFLFVRKDTRYMRKILEKTDQIASGSFVGDIAVSGNDELGCIATNINQMQQTIRQVMERERMAERTKNDLISSVAHDLRTPLTSIIGYMGWIREQTDLDEATRTKYINIAYDKAKRLEQLTNELFDFVKQEHNELKLHYANLDLVQLLGQMLDEMSPQFVKYDIVVTFHHDVSQAFLSGDGELLARLFANLLNNAVKYGREGKQIIVEMEKHLDRITTRITNFGHVIPKEEITHLFDKFFRTERSRSRETGGTGLGLAIVQQIVELHHGTVGVKSDLQGTVFTVDLPVRQEEQVVG